ncbi:PH domain-containing protein [Geodermatophilus sabuli]|uniref:PH domain-containing protein n=1 Tax=Geodermatophilus sabuli TaxID=1564158 RepID=A0A285E837_9ACTN|nr:PH domain-containing protein [Geodermatophilus sabuli]MBB3081838.1 cytochrome c biogenesis protein CcdA [Geodermatophilus sabuli]SNX95289.1 PH domain-containing protein [Geodermatophilus sabuli]
MLPTPVSAVPRRWRLLCAVVAVVVAAVLTYVGLTLQDDTTGVVTYTTADQVAVVLLGLVLAAGVLALGRPRVDADADGIRVRNLFGQRHLPWTAVQAVRFDERFKWATLLLRNDDEFAVLALQAADGERAAEAVEGLRALLAAARAAEPAPPPLLHDPRERPQTPRG